MKKTVHFRLREEYASLLLAGDVGRLLGDGYVRAVTLDFDDPLVRRIEELQSELSKRGESCFSYSEVRRSYTARELSQAKLLSLFPKRWVEPAGEECGTQYDDLLACPQCGSGAPQITPLFLDGRRLPRGADFFYTLGSEIVVSSRFARLVESERLEGASLHELRLCNEGGALCESYCQLKVNGSELDLHNSTHVGTNLFDKDADGRCDVCDLVGINLISEISIVASSVPHVDFMVTKQMVGVRRGLLRPRRLLLVSQRAWRAITKAKLKGFVFEVAHLV